MDLNLHLVRYLVAVVDEGHFGRAAQRLYVSAPALSQQVRKLERSLGVELIDRSTRPLRPTPAGERFLAEARDSLAAADRAVAAVAAHRLELTTTLRLGFMTASAGPLTRHLLDELRHEVPGVSVRLVELPWPQQASAVREVIVDAALIRPPITETVGLRLDVVCHEPRVVALPVTHRLATHAEVGLADLDGEPHVTSDEADPAWVRWWACDPRPSGAPVRYGPSVRTMDELLEVVATGQAVAITGRFVADSQRHSGVTFVPLIGIESCPLSLCTRADDGSPLVAALRGAVHRLHANDPTHPRRPEEPGPDGVNPIDRTCSAAASSRASMTSLPTSIPASW
ncbi:LysR family transcriptional regulator [Streptomyces sp. NBC_00257]|uniref:LysR family transcriptional regulator n=1 Tax=unclassified Streptomyces TaxID=2593676 RepID=UPI00225AE672|nr:MULTISPECIES: LysR family transcriptional regulator [unclassified Streptomyces]MCX4398660.1 LysR family transcriptional regulator [Streptomyces sp. NBC_01767]MCX4871008.1 LysR family transcriptional regulator [Streptomyces sp. NBC_00906]MCX4901748.1 LysR family transcriptional regulator [Streptomyces sp. NBC_00892]MCX5426990.1 LysR family transcriptional regulator [Streptomyces sp. NBC_00062]WSP50962.1 LysR family transcriptional regulator [Streptomyces sp. NBC_01243]